MATVVRLPSVHGRLLEMTEGNSTSSWEEIVNQVHGQMLSLAGPSPELEDLTQTALEQVLRSAERFRGECDFATFTYRICAHVLLNHWRWWKRWTLRFDRSERLDAADERPGPTEVVLEQERARRLRACLARLAPMKRLVLTLADFEDLPASRIASIVGCGQPTVRSRLRQARRELTKLLAADPLFGEEVRHEEL